MSAKKIIPVILMMLAAAACRPDKAIRPEKNLLLSDDKLVEVLTDTYLAGGMLDVASVRIVWGKRDSISNYLDVIESHGCTYEQMEATMRYYFAAKPKKLSRIYDRVTGNLLKLEAVIQNESQPEKNKADENLWTGKASYAMPEDTPNDPVWFDIPVDKQGVYTLRAEYQVYSDDKSIDPRVTLFFSTTDSLGTETRDFWDEVPLTRDGKIQNIEISKTLDKPGPVHIKGWLLNHTSQQGQWKKHARIRNISLKLEKETAATE